MKHYKSERLKKMEAEFNDLEQWLKLGLVPKRDIPKHEDEIKSLSGKIKEELERLTFLRESGESEEYVTPKRGPTRAGYTEMPTIPDIDSPDTAMTGQDTNYGADTDSGTSGNSVIEEKDDGEATQTDETDAGYFNPNKWREGIVDPEVDEW